MQTKYRAWLIAFEGAHLATKHDAPRAQNFVLRILCPIFW